MSRGYTKCLTIIDQFTRFPEAIPLENADADTVAVELIRHWISRYGVPLRITSDQGTQFSAVLFQALMRILGVKYLRTTPYHPASNGLVERLHRQLKAALLCHNDIWFDALPAVLLRLRAAWKEDLQATPVELVYGEPIRIPGELLVPSNKHADAPGVLQDLQAHFNNLAPAET
ncbi:insertion element IS476 uncharacterized 39.2 kDa protein-like [Microplitis mediator]|uniref:insertion element IS476 uncharacterized 39.2 kDa protein-like n=1 Tax=Microplitis mediator TaxID=375433 RepID=UPI002554E6CF|nr:insertion element IS476 uncharacterized 39.2 kDa protein-like [Microplitis mediator]